MTVSPQKREQRPVFVVGCHRSGTNLLYDVLLAAGGFAVYRGYLPVFKMLIPHFGSIANSGNRSRMVEAWLHSKGFRRSNLNAAEIKEKLIGGCRNGGDFFRIVMDEIAQQQGMPRWSVYDPDNVLYMRKIKRDIPNALFVQIVRDGRDVAVSLRKMGEFRPIPWHRQAASLEATAIYWRWMVQTCRMNGQLVPEDYYEIRYEDLIGSPESALPPLGQFLGQELNYDRIRKVAFHRKSNSSFLGSAAPIESNPVERWRRLLSPQEVATLEALVGDCLQETGYKLSAPEGDRRLHLRHAWMRATYPALLRGKLWLKTKTPAGRFSSISALEMIDEHADAKDENPDATLVAREGENTERVSGPR